MKPTALIIVIPVEIVALPDLTLAERVALSHIQKFPGCSNARLARLLGMSLRGVEEMLRRLRQRGLIQQIRRGRARVHRLIYHVEHHTECGKNQYAESQIESGNNELVDSNSLCGLGIPLNVEQLVIAPSQAAAPAEEKLSPEMVIKREYNCAQECLDRWDFAGALHHYKLIKERIALLPDTSAEDKSKLLDAFQEEETRVLACKLAAEHAVATKMPHAEFKALVAAIKSLSEERLAQIRPALEAQSRLGTIVDIAALLIGESGRGQ